jgi:DNA-directed RNA polymerase specialized sigma24 family protein
VTASPTALRRAALGDAEAVRQIIDVHGSMVWSLVQSQVTGEAAESAVQDVFLDVWKHASRFDLETLSEEAARGEVVPQPVPEGASAEGRLAADALRDLDPDRRRVLQLVIVEGLGPSRVAELTELPRSAVEGHARRGLASVRAALAGRREAAP